MSQPRRFVILLTAAAAAATTVAVVRHGRRHRTTGSRRILIGDSAGYDAIGRLVLGPFFAGIAADVAAAAPDRARVLEVGCGPGRLSIRLARQPGLEVTGLDLDLAMIERARANADRRGNTGGGQASFLVGDVASLAFPDRSFDLVVSTLSMHHWADPAAGLTEIGRVLRPGGRALIWDLRPGALPFHAHAPDPVEHTHDAPLRLVGATPWPWPWRLNLPSGSSWSSADGAPGDSET